MSDDRKDDPQPTPHGQGQLAHYLAQNRLEKRRIFGTEKYGEPLKAFNGRHAAKDLVDETADALAYSEVVMLEYNTLLKAVMRYGSHDSDCKHFGQMAFTLPVKMCICGLAQIQVWIRSIPEFS